MRLSFAAALLVPLGCAASEAPPPLPPPTQGSSLASSIPPAPVPADGGGPQDAAAPPTPEQAIQAAIAAEDRDEDDRRLDAERHPAEILSFLGVAPGQRLGELVAGGGYFTELVARVVGETGDVWAENPSETLDAYAARPWETRMGKPIMKQVHSVTRPLDAPLPPDAHDLDGVVLVMFDHDAPWVKVDRAKTDKAVFDAIKHGGFFGIVDADPSPERRPDAKKVIDEATKVGFTLGAQGDLLHAGEKHPGAAPLVLKLVKP